jgi:DNA processing protein
MNSANQRREWACWLTLAFRLERLQRRSINGLVLTADRNLKLGLTALAELEPEALPEPLRKYAEVHRQLFEADGKVSAQAFVVERLLEEGIRVVPITSASYPAHLARTLSAAKAPTVLTVVGNPELLKEQGVSVSGSRAAGPQGLAFARAMGHALARAGITVVSGLARGCDREALEGALEVGGKAIGVAPEGALQTKERKRPEVEAGRLAVVSEFAPSDKWTVARAMARNQTIAGLGRALVVADCVAPGGTTDQVEVARGLGLAVFLRRGVGEGAMVAQLAARPGVVPVKWNGGAISLPGLLPGERASTKKPQAEQDSQLDFPLMPQQPD